MLGEIAPLPPPKKTENVKRWIERLCQALEKGPWEVVRDKSALRYGDRISSFMKTLSRADTIIVVLSAKYLRSPYCLTELYDIYEQSLREKEGFLQRIIPIVLDDAKITDWSDRVIYTKHWETEFKTMEKNLIHLGGEDINLYKAMRRWHNEVADMLAYINDVLHPHGFEAIVKDNFAALRHMLEERTRS
jgi:internalin A